MDKIQISIANKIVVVETLDTPTAKAIVKELPFSSNARTWGEEVYFPVPVTAALEDDARDLVEAGEIAFWVEGQCIAIGFGPTPISQGNEIRLAARTNIWAKALNDVTELKSIRDGDSILVSLVEED